MTDENISHEFKWKKMDETRNYFIEEINENELTCKKEKKVCIIICIITAGIKNYKATTKKKKHDEILLLAKAKLNSVEVLISKASIAWKFNHDEIIPTNNVLKHSHKK